MYYYLCYYLYSYLYYYLFSFFIYCKSQIQNYFKVVILLERLSNYVGLFPLKTVILVFRERPLALYVFTKRPHVISAFRNSTSSGSLMINDTVSHVAGKCSDISMSTLFHSKISNTQRVKYVLLYFTENNFLNKLAIFNLITLGFISFRIILLI